MSFIDTVYDRARARKARVAFPEYNNQGILLAVRRVVDEGIAEAVLVGAGQDIAGAAAEAGVCLDGIEVFDTGDTVAIGGLLERYSALPSRAIGAKALERRVGSSLYVAMALEAVGDVDVTFAGADTSTFEFLMAARGIIGLADGISAPSSLAIAEVPGFKGGQGPVLGFGDVAVNTDPDAETLAQIAMSCCDSFASLVGRPARCAMLSYSTLGSGSGPMVDLVRSATRIANEARPDLMIDGEFQLDAAVNAEIGEKKVRRESEVAGRADLLVLPNLSVGNVFIKTLQQYAGAMTFGPIYQGFASPVVDCSRGDGPQAIFDAVAMGAAMANHTKAQN